MSEYGLRIKNIEAGTLYECNNGARETFKYTNAMLTNSLFLDFMLSNGLKIWKGTMTRDIIGLEFNQGSRSLEEEVKHLEDTKKKYLGLDKPDIVAKIDGLIEYANAHPQNFIKKTKEEIRTEFYKNGVDVTYVTRKKNGEIKKSETIHYKMLFRSTGKAKKGSCMFIRDRLYNRAIDFLRTGIRLPKHHAPIVEISAYAPLISSTIIDRIKINPRNILVVKDVDRVFRTNVVSVETDDQKHCVARAIEDYEVKNTLFDGQALIDSRLFPKWGNGYILLRHHFCKMAAFNANIQDFYSDYFGDNYNTAEVVDMWGNRHKAKDIELITTENAMKWMKWDVSYDYWCRKVEENGSLFGIVKTAHKSKLGEVQRMSYQMVNALDIDIMPNVMQNSLDYINALKTDDAVFLDYLSKNANFANDYEVLVALVEQDGDFIRSSYFRNRRKEIIRTYTLNFKSGHINQNGDNLVIVGSPYAMLLHSVGASIDDDTTFEHEDGTIQCYTERFEDGAYLAEFRSPFNSKNNLGYLHNVRHRLIEKYFNLGEQVIAVNMIGTDFQDRNNGSDQDSDSLYVTDQPDIVSYAKYCYANYPTIVNNIPKESKSYDDDFEQFAEMDNNLAAAQMAIGESSNLAQIALTYSYNFQDQKFKDYVCILSVVAQVAIDNAKRRYDLDLINEIKHIKKDMNLKQNGYPAFWGVVKKDFNRNLINPKLVCPMNCLCAVKIENYRSPLSTLPMETFFQPYQMERDRKQCRRVEELIQKYSLDVFNEVMDEQENWLILREDFDQLILDIRQVYFSKTYLGLMSWLIDRAFGITSKVSVKKPNMNSTTNTNLSLLMRVLYSINPTNLLKIFSKNAQKC